MISSFITISLFIKIFLSIKMVSFTVNLQTLVDGGLFIVGLAMKSPIEFHVFPNRLCGYTSITHFKSIVHNCQILVVPTPIHFSSCCVVPYYAFIVSHQSAITVKMNFILKENSILFEKILNQSKIPESYTIRIRVKS